MKEISRRELLTKLAGFGVAAAGLELLSNTQLLGMIQKAEASPQKSTVVVAAKGSIMQQVGNAVAKLGGMEKFVKKGAKVVIKPNAAWARTPVQAANTNPEVINALINLCKKAGAGSITLYEHPCDNYRISFDKSGIEEVCKRNNVKMIAADKDNMYREVAIPKAKALKKAKMNRAILDADCYINVPIVKVHGGGTATICLKNQMGCVLDRGFFHRSGLHQCIADAALMLKPALNVADATRILLTNGPSGPGEVKDEKKIIAGTDMVAIDAYGATLLGYKPGDVGHIKRAWEHGLGQMDLDRIDLVFV